MAQVWNNSDGLRVEFGTEKVKPAQAGVPSTAGAIREVELVLEASRMVLTGGIIGGRSTVAIPGNSYIVDATLIVTEGFDSGTTATLDLGFSNSDGTYTNLSETGIDVAIAETAIDTAGKKVACDGAYVGTITPNFNCYPSYDLDTAVYTTGKGILLIRYIPQLYPDQTAN